MKALYWHVDYLKYQATKKALKSAPDLDEKEGEIKEGIVVLLSFEKGDNEEALKKFVKDIIEYANQIKTNKIMLYPYAHLSKNLLSPNESINLLIKLKHNKELKKHFEEIKTSPFGWYKSFEVKVKGHPLAELSRTF